MNEKDLEGQVQKINCGYLWIRLSVVFIFCSSKFPEIFTMSICYFYFHCIHHSRKKVHANFINKYIYIETYMQMHKYKHLYVKHKISLSVLIIKFAQ